MTERPVEHSFLAFEPLLWRVLSSLAKRGFVAAPLDARDVIHDFYLEAWDGVGRRFDQSLGDFKTYLSSSFYKFARRRIVALRGWRHSLVDIDLLSNSLVDDISPQRVVEQRQLVSAIRTALSHLPRDERVVLYDYLRESEPSERTIALRHSLSRYACRELLLNALGRVAVEMGRSDGERKESLVAFYLWREGRSPRNVSALLEIPVSEVMRCKTEFAAQLLFTLRGSYPSPQRVQTGELMMSPIEDLKAALLSPGNKKLLDKLKSVQRLKGLSVEDLDSLEFTDEETRVLERNSEWVADVYALIAGNDDAEEDEGAVAAALIAVRQDAEREIGEAFVNLLERLDGSEFADWRRYFGYIGTVGNDEQAFYLEAPSFVEGVPRAKLLASYGLTPLMFHDSVRGMELLFDRLVDSRPKFARQHEEPPFPDVLLSGNEHSLSVPGSIVVSQLATTPGMKPTAVRGMAHWLGDVLLRVPLLIRGYNANWHSGQLNVLQLSDEANRADTVDDIVRRWTQVTAIA